MTSSPHEELNNTPGLSAPEILWPEEKKPFSSAVDVWAMVCIMFENFSDRALFSLVYCATDEVCEDSH